MNTKEPITLAEDFQLSIPSHRQILNTIRIQKEISGAELARQNNLRPSTLVYILRALKERGLVEISRVASRHKTAGKPPTLWRLVADKGYIFGIEVIPKELRGTVLNFRCDVVHQEHQIGVENIGEENLIDAVAQFVDRLQNHLGLPREKIIGVGAALTGLVDREAGIVRYSRRLDLEDFPAQQRLVERLQLPVEVVNDANAGALGIKWQVEDDVGMMPNVVFLTLNEKTAYFGAGLILNQTLYEGMNGAAGEICDALPSLDEFINRVRTRIDGDSPLLRLKREGRELSIEEVIDCARNGCELSRETLAEYGRMISSEILRIVQLLAPNVVVIGGDIADAREFIHQQIIDDVDRSLKALFPAGITAPEIRFSQFGSYSVSVGAAALIMLRIFLP